MGFRVWGLGFGVQGLGLRVWGLSKGDDGAACWCFEFVERVWGFPLGSACVRKSKTFIPDAKPLLATSGLKL